MLRTEFLNSLLRRSYPYEQEHEKVSKSFFKILASAKSYALGLEENKIRVTAKLLNEASLVALRNSNAWANEVSEKIPSPNYSQTELAYIILDTISHRWKEPLSERIALIRKRNIEAGVPISVEILKEENFEDFYTTYRTAL